MLMCSIIKQKVITFIDNRKGNAIEITKTPVKKSM